MADITAKEWRAPFNKVYSNLDYYEFCKLLELDPDYSMEYWLAWQKIAQGLGKFSDTSLQKILDYDGKKS